MAFEVFLIIASFVAGVAVYREYAVRSRRPGIRLKVETIDFLTEDTQTAIKVTNIGNRTESQVQVLIAVKAPASSALSCQYMKATAHRIPRVFAAERPENDDLIRGNTCIFIADEVAPEDTLVFVVESSEPLHKIHVVASAATVSEAYVYPSEAGLDPGITIT